MMITPSALVEAQDRGLAVFLEGAEMTLLPIAQGGNAEVCNPGRTSQE